MSQSRLVRGEAIRRQVMGDAHVERALNNVSEFERDLQNYVMEAAWGTVWDRDDAVLPRKTRSLMTLSMLIALRATEELKGHVRGALRNGCTPAEIREVILHSAAYCGCPAALSASRVAQAVLEQNEREQNEREQRELAPGGAS